MIHFALTVTGRVIEQAINRRLKDSLNEPDYLKGSSAGSNSTSKLLFSRLTSESGLSFREGRGLLEGLLLIKG